MADHIVSAFTDELDKIAADLMRMGGIVETMILDSCLAVDRNDHSLAKDVISRDPSVDRLEEEVERQIVSLIARRQPMAHDLRSVFADAFAFFEYCSRSDRWIRIFYILLISWICDIGICWTVG